MFTDIKKNILLALALIISAYVWYSVISYFADNRDAKATVTDVKIHNEVARKLNDTVYIHNKTILDKQIELEEAMDAIHIDYNDSVDDAVIEWL